MTAFARYINDAMSLNDHGGDCCGRVHISELSHYGPRIEAVERLQYLLDRDMYDFYDTPDEGSTGQLGVEVTLTDNQANTKPTVFKHSYPIKDCSVKKDDPYKDRTWDEVLTQVLGFKKVFSFNSPKTDNIVHVYFYSENEV